MRSFALAYSHTVTARILTGFLAAILAAAALSVSAPSHGARAGRADRVATAFSVAKHQTGTRYVYGASDPRRGFDCSGLTQFAYERAHLRLPRTSRGQARAATRIPRSQLQRGDLMFFASHGRVYHVGMYAGRAAGRVQILHAPRPGERVKVDPVWTPHWFAGTVRR